MYAEMAVDVGTDAIVCAFEHYGGSGERLAGLVDHGARHESVVGIGLSVGLGERDCCAHDLVGEAELLVYGRVKELVER